MKRTRILLLLFLLLAGGTAWYFMSDASDTTTSRKNANDQHFFVEDVDQIHKIFIAERSGEQPVTLQRNGDHWIYNDTWKAMPNSVELLLDMIRRVRVEYIPPDAAKKNIVKGLATSGIKVELYDKMDKQLKAFYIGGMTNEETSTYMIMEGSNEPYACYIPGWVGNLRARFEKTHPDDWRDRTLFGYKGSDIVYFSAEYPKQNNQSFVIEKKEDVYTVRPLNALTPLINGDINQNLVQSFLSEFEFVQAEAFRNNFERKDQVKQWIPFCVITMRTGNGDEKTVKFIPQYKTNEQGEIVRDQPDVYYEHYYLDVDNGDFMVGQHLVFKKLFWSYASFFK